MVSEYVSHGCKAELKKKFFTTTVIVTNASMDPVFKHVRDMDPDREGKIIWIRAKYGSSTLAHRYYIKKKVG